MIGWLRKPWLSGVLVWLSIAGAARAAPAYTPTMADMMSLNAMLHRYLMWIDKRDNKAFASVCTVDCVVKLYDHGKLDSVLNGRDALANGRPPRQRAPGGANGGVSPKMFHMISNDSWDFESPTRVRHFAYWLDVTPGEGQTSSLGASGHYEDVFVKQDGEWLIQERNIFVGSK